MKMSERDKKLVLIVVIVLILVLPYIGLFLPLRKLNGLNTEKVKELEGRLEYLTQIEQSKDYYMSETAKYQQDSAALTARFPDDIRQEDILLFIDRTEKLLPISIAQAAFSENAAAPLESEAQTETEETADGEYSPSVDEQLAAVQEFAEKIQEEGYNTYDVAAGLVGINTSTQLSYACSYDSFKKLVNYIEQYEERLVITDISASYEEMSNLVNGSIKLSQFALAGAAKQEEQKEEPEKNGFTPKLPGQKLGSSNIFEAASAGGSVLEVNPDERLEGTTYDYFLILSNAQSDIPGKTMGKAQDSAGATYLKSAENNRQKAGITFEGKDGLYTATYFIGDLVYPAGNGEMQPTDMGQKLEFAVLSSPRVGEEDGVEAEISVVNRTDRPVTVKVINDDAENPRVHITGKTGKVEIEE